MKGAHPSLPAVCQSPASHLMVARLKSGLLSEGMKFSKKKYIFYKSNLLPESGVGNITAAVFNII